MSFLSYAILQPNVVRNLHILQRDNEQLPVTLSHMQNFDVKHDLLGRNCSFPTNQCLQKISTFQNAKVNKYLPDFS